MWHHDPRNVTWCLGWIFQNYFSEICLIISWGTLYLDPSKSLKRIFEFSVGGLLSISMQPMHNLPELDNTSPSFTSLQEYQLTLFYWHWIIPLRMLRPFRKINWPYFYLHWNTSSSFTSLQDDEMTELSFHHLRLFRKMK